MTATTFGTETIRTHNKLNVNDIDLACDCIKDSIEAFGDCMSSDNCITRFFGDCIERLDSYLVQQEYLSSSFVQGLAGVFIEVVDRHEANIGSDIVRDMIRVMQKVLAKITAAAVFTYIFMWAVPKVALGVAIILTASSAYASVRILETNASRYTLGKLTLIAASFFVSIWYKPKIALATASVVGVTGLLISASVKRIWENAERTRAENAERPLAYEDDDSSNSERTIAENAEQPRIYEIDSSSDQDVDFSDD